MLISDFKILERILKPHKIRNLYYFKPLKGFSIDSRSIRKHQGFIAIKGKYHDGHKFIKSAVSKGASFVVAQKYVPTKRKVPFFIVEDTYCSLKAIATYIRKEKKPFVYAITGSMGKTTTKEILSFLLEPYCKVLKNEKTENNILGVTKTILSLKSEKVMVVELGTNKKGEINSLANICKPDVGVITFIRPVHLEGLGSLKSILKEKKSLFNVNTKMKAVLNRDDPLLAKSRINRKTYWFGKGKKGDLSWKLLKRENSKIIFLIQNKYKFALPSHYELFIENFMAAVLGAHVLGIGLKQLIERASKFKNFPPMRMQREEFKNFTIINDTYNANPYSFKQTLGALREHPLKKVAVIGDMLELGKKSMYYHKQLASLVIKNNFDYCLTFGKEAFYLKQRLRQLGYSRAFHFKTHKEIAGFIKKLVYAKNFKKRYLIFLKGSRKMELEKVLNYL